MNEYNLPPTSKHPQSHTQDIADRYHPCQTNNHPPIRKIRYTQLPRTCYPVQNTSRDWIRCLDSKMRQIMNDNWNDNKEDKTINKFKKRWQHEGYNISTFLQKPDIPPDNNEIERMNRRFVSIRSDGGGGNRTSAGMECNSILFTVRATCNLNNVSFYDTLCSASSEYG